MPALLAAAPALIFAGCDDGLEPRPWFPIPDTVQLYSLARAEHISRPGAYDFFPSPHVGQPIILELTGNPFGFDMGFTETETGEFVLVPTGWFPAANVTPGIKIDSTGATFDELSQAPREGYSVDEPVPAEPGLIYVVRSRTVGLCRVYGKMEILEIDADGVLLFRHLTNPNCGDRSLIPNAELEEEEDGEEGGGEGGGGG